MDQYLSLLILGPNDSILVSKTLPFTRVGEAWAVRGIAEALLLYPQWETVLLQRKAPFYEDEPIEIAAVGQGSPPPNPSSLTGRRNVIYLPQRAPDSPEGEEPPSDPTSPRTIRKVPRYL